MPCRRCGACCDGVHLEINGDEDKVRFWQLHGVVFGARGDGKYILKIPGVCRWFDQATRGCSRYDERPALCRNYLCPAAREG